MALANKANVHVSDPSLKETSPCAQVLGVVVAPARGRRLYGEPTPRVAGTGGVEGAGTACARGAAGAGEAGAGKAGADEVGAGEAGAVATTVAVIVTVAFTLCDLLIEAAVWPCNWAEASHQHGNYSNSIAIF